MQNKLKLLARLCKIGNLRKNVIFVHVETTGKSKVYSNITTIGWYIDGQYNYVLLGNDISAFIRDLTSADILITFGGSRLDIPFLKHKFNVLNNILDEICHLDLKNLLARYGYKGTQKELEMTFGFNRPKSLATIDQGELILFWHSFIRGDDRSLHSLLYHNCYTVLGMAFLLNHALFSGAEYPSLLNINCSKKIIYKYRRSFTTLNQNKCTCSRQYVAENITFFKHRNLKSAYPYNVLGIDLTSSENKASGCALIGQNNVITKRVHSDDELIKLIEKYHIDLVSLDSPLSLPYGRTSVFDDDPMRAFGITRLCERELKKRGVYVYPTLIPSMQKLTLRGMQLSSKIRKLGVPVIESFPGGAQDVLQIPRKKASITQLRQGLIDFGLMGDFVYKKITHDELDAITAALVGQFYLAGYYEAVGNDDEGCIVIPSFTCVR